MCDDGDVLYKKDGTRWGCFNGNWVRLPRRAVVVPPPTAVAHARIVEMLDDELLAAIEDPDRIVVAEVYYLDVGEAENEDG